MEITIGKTAENPYLQRKEVQGEVTFEGATPSQKQIAEALAAKIGAKADAIFIMHVYTGFGSNKAKFEAHVYPSKEQLEKVVRLGKKAKEKLAGKPASGAAPAAEAKPAPAAAPKAEEKKEAPKKEEPKKEAPKKEEKKEEPKKEAKPARAEASADQPTKSALPAEPAKPAEKKEALKKEAPKKEEPKKAEVKA